MKFKNVVGIEPAKNLRKINKDKGIDINTIYFNEKNSNLIKKKYINFKVITANNVCAHTPDLKSFFKGIKNILHPKGIFIFEVSYLVDVFKKLTFDTMYHEHMSYHALLPLINFIKKLGLEIFDFERVEAQGGSIRIFVAKKNTFKVKKGKINRQVKIEKKLKLFKESSYVNFFNKIKKNKKYLHLILNKFIKKKMTIVGFGAPAKLTTFTYFMGINKKHLHYIVDESKLKQNKYTPGTKIKIYSTKQFSKKKPDVILVLAWNFFDSIQKKCKVLVKNKIKLINPFPKINVINQ